MVSLVHLYFPMFTIIVLFVFSHALHRIGFTFLTALTCHSSFESNGIKSVKQATDNIWLKFEKQVKSSVQICFPAVEPRAIFQTRKILPSIRKDAVPITQQSLVVHQYICCCDCRYVSHTSFRLQERITQHIPKSFQNKRKVNKSSAKTKLQSQDSFKPIGMWFGHWTSLTLKSWLTAHYHD